MLSSLPDPNKKKTTCSLLSTEAGLVASVTEIVLGATKWRTGGNAMDVYMGYRARKHS